MANTTIKLTDGYAVEIEEYNHTLCRMKTSKKGNNVGNVYREVIGYFPDMESAVKRFLEEDVKDQLDGMQDMTVSEYFDRHKEIVEKAVEDIVKAVGK